ncbi:DNA-dependent ATPase fun30 [Coemansia sp. RSA 989]|nr:DNA-dependent ATPase fun30 [Coemansia sp. RSA 1086]KAJ1748289.1 DNA-dependent ATPase fun30 [Coemansia sp. RSA 1821]KAJ1864474.1 DNA-dependent ATPase fun30 [Coemansia sp. RSA 989]KAJ1870277.1 DNA-dependent ATPase fun30 [Coemansia sp. RSA 990]
MRKNLLAPATPEHISSSQSSTLEPTDTDDLVILESSPGRPGTSKVQHISKTPSGINRLSSFYFNGPPSGSISQPSDSLPSSPLNSEAQVGQATGRIKQMDISKSPKHTTKQGMRELVSKFRMKGAPEEESSSDSELDLPSRLVSGSKRKLARKRTVDALSSPERSMSKRATPDTVDVSSDSDDLPMRGSRRSRLQRGSRLTHTARSSSPDAQPSRKTLARKPAASSAVVDLSDEDSDGMPGGTFTRQYETIEPHVMKLFNRGTKDELMEKTGATGDEAQAIIKLRPFEDMEAIEYSMRRTKGLRLSLFTQYRNSILGHAEVEAVIFQCSGVFAQLKQAMRKAGMLSNDKTGAVSLADNIQLEQPQMISKNYQLKHYQLEGVEWLNCLRNSNASGILADEMGLGKTFQVIAFICKGLEEGRVKGPSLVVCPSSTLDNWMNECAKFAPSLRAVAYCGSQAERLALQSELQDEETYDVLITTYQLATGNKLDRMFLKKRQFHSMILDEGHMVKNCMSSRYKWLMQIRTPFRLLLTGTPLQNNLQELVSLLTFILPQVFAESQPMLTNAFKAKAPVKRSAGADSDDGTVASSMGDSGTQTPVQPSTVGPVDAQHIEQAKTLLRPFVLRRRKCDVLNDLPSKTENIVNVELTPTQRKLYDSISTDAQVKSEDIRQKLMKLDPNKIDLTESAEKQATKLNGSSWISTFMNMRKVSDHPLLLRSRYDKPMLKQMAKLLMREPDYADANYEYVLEDMEVCSDFELHEICTTYPRMHKFKLPDEALLDSGKIEQLKKIVDECISRGEKLLLFSQFTTMLNILEKVFALWKIEYFRLDGQTKVDERQGLIDEFNSKDNQVPVFLLSTKAGGFGINLTASNVVVIYDSGNNPSEERQAEDRAHRVGQVKDVRVYKLIGTNTIDEDILESSRSKQLVEHMLWF